MSQELILNHGELEIDRNELYISLGYKGGSPQGEALEIIDSLLAEAALVCKPRFGYAVLEGEVSGKELRLAGNTLHPDAIISHYLKGCDSYAIIIATVGREMDNWIHEYRDGGDIMKAFVADCIGSITAEAVASWGRKRLKEIFAVQGLNTTNSYSPGYCGWNVSEQRTVFGLIPPEFCGVTLCESGLMLPIKSVSAVIGIGKDAVENPYGCDICRKPDCYRRRL